MAARRQGVWKSAPDLLRGERWWLPEFTPQLPVSVPTPIFLVESSVAGIG
jgi:hypothetical protein